MGKIVRYQAGRAVKLSRDSEVIAEEKRVLKALKELLCAGDDGVRAMICLVDKCCLNFALIIEPPEASVLKKHGLMESGGGITETVKRTVRLTDDELLKEARDLIRVYAGKPH